MARERTTNADGADLTNAPDTGVNEAAEAGQGGGDIVVTEGDVHAAADAAAVSRLSGHTANLALWENSPEGKKWLEEEAPKRNEQAQKENEEAQRQAEVSAAAADEYARRVAANATQTEKAAADLQRQREEDANK
jgi:hypothetical protein